MSNFKNLRVWNDALDLAQQVYTQARIPPFASDWALRNQITRAVISISSNIAEGDERGTARECVHFLHIAKGSTAEVITQLHLAHRLGYLDAATLIQLENTAEKIRASLKNLIQARGGSNPLKMLLWLAISFLRPV